MDFKPSGEFINPHFDDLLFETIGDDFFEKWRNCNCNCSR